MIRKITKVAFGITGDEIIPEQISNKLGILPDSTMKKGDEIRPGIMSKSNFWEIESKIDNQIDLHKHIYYIVNKIKPVAEEIKKLSTIADIYIIAYIHVSANESVPSIYFDRAMLKFISEINAEIGIDIFVEEASSLAEQ